MAAKHFPWRMCPSAGHHSKEVSLSLAVFVKQSEKQTIYVMIRQFKISTPKLSSVGTSKPLLSLTRWYTQSIYCINKQTWKCMTSRWNVLVLELFILLPTSKVSEPNTFGSTTKPTLQTKVLRIPYPYRPHLPHHPSAAHLFNAQMRTARAHVSAVSIHPGLRCITSGSCFGTKTTEGCRNCCYNAVIILRLPWENIAKWKIIVGFQAFIKEKKTMNPHMFCWFLIFFRSRKINLGTFLPTERLLKAIVRSSTVTLGTVHLNGSSRFSILQLRNKQNRRRKSEILFV